MPCPHLSNCSCTIYYSEKIKRPLVCGKFKCKLLVSKELGKTSFDEALELIEKAKQLAEQNNQLLNLAFPDLKALSASKKIKVLKNMFEKADDQITFRKQYGNLLLNSFAFETWLKKYFITDPNKKHKTPNYFL